MGVGPYLQCQGSYLYMGKAKMKLIINARGKEHREDIEKTEDEHSVGDRGETLVSCDWWAFNMNYSWL